MEHIGSTDSRTQFEIRLADPVSSLFFTVVYFGSNKNPSVAVEIGIIHYQVLINHF